MSHALAGKRILIVEDDLSLLQFMDLIFEQVGAHAVLATEGRAGLRRFREQEPDLVILDVFMPGMDGWDVCQEIRRESTVPVIMLTTLDDDNSMIRGLDYGADDFLSKPFNPDVLLARARAVLRRAYSAAPAPSSLYDDGYLTIDVERKIVAVRSEPVKLTATEFRLLSFLIQGQGSALSYRQILENVWGEAYQDSINYVHVYVSHLRRKLELDPGNPRYLVTVHQVGYRFVSQR